MTSELIKVEELMKQGEKNEIGDSGVIVLPKDIGLPKVEDKSAQSLVKEAEERIELMKKITYILLNLTTSSDWVDLGGRPYLLSEGAERVGAAIGISWKFIETKTETDKDGHFTYYVKGLFRWRDREIEAVGSRSSRDPFFSKSHNTIKSPEEIDRTRVEKAAYTNCINNGIKRILAIRNIPWDELVKANITPLGKTKVIYKKQDDKKSDTDRPKEDFISIMERERKRVGQEAFLRILGENGYETLDQIKIRSEQIRIYQAISALPSIEQ